MDISFDSLGGYLVRSKLWAFRGDEYGSLSLSFSLSYEVTVSCCAALRRGERSAWRRGAVGLDGEEPDGLFEDNSGLSPFYSNVTFSTWLPIEIPRAYELSYSNVTFSTWLPTKQRIMSHVRYQAGLSGMAS